LILVYTRREENTHRRESNLAVVNASLTSQNGKAQLKYTGNRQSGGRQKKKPAKSPIEGRMEKGRGEKKKVHAKRLDRVQSAKKGRMKKE